MLLSSDLIWNAGSADGSHTVTSRQDSVFNILCLASSVTEKDPEQISLQVFMLKCAAHFVTCSFQNDQQLHSDIPVPSVVCVNM